MDHEVHRKTVAHVDRRGDARELTFSCVHSQPLIHEFNGYAIIAECVVAACSRLAWDILAFVIMPNHVHLLVLPTDSPAISPLLYAIKKPVSQRIKSRLIMSGSPRLEHLTVQERPGKWCFRFWQEGPGYDRNLIVRRSVDDSIDYIHRNPVHHGLCAEPGEWPWSSFWQYRALAYPSKAKQRPMQTFSHAPEAHEALLPRIVLR